MRAIKENSALIIVDVQNDFLKGGALEVNNGNDVIPVINKIQKKFSINVATQDWHPSKHKSFASQHSENSIGDFINLNGINQILWPDHCVENTFGSEFSKDLDTEKLDAVVKKGNNPEIDSYSGFLENDKKSETELNAYLKSKNIKNVYICGLASDYCVKFTAFDAVDLQYEVYLIEDATKGVNINTDDHKNAIEEMKQIGVHIISSSDLI